MSENYENASPRPWKHDDGMDYMYDSNGEHIFTICGNNTALTQDILNGQLIVTAVNAYDGMRAAIEHTIRELQRVDCLTPIDLEILNKTITNLTKLQTALSQK